MLRTAFIIDHICLPQWAWDKQAFEHECDANAGNLLPKGSWREVPCIRLALFWREVSHISLALMPKGLLICIPGLSGIILSTVYVNKKVPINSSISKQKESRRIMNMETDNNTVNKTVVEFNYFNHSYIDTDSLANDQERLRRDSQLYSHAKIMPDNAHVKLTLITAQTQGTNSYYSSISVW